MTFEQMYKKLNADSKCHFLIFGFDDDVDFKNPESTDWYFDMKTRIMEKFVLTEQFYSKNLEFIEEK